MQVGSTVIEPSESMVKRVVYWKLDVDRKALVGGKNLDAIALWIPRIVLRGVSHSRVQLWILLADANQPVENSLTFLLSSHPLQKQICQDLSGSRISRLHSQKCAPP